MSKLLESAKKKNKGGMDLKPFHIKGHVWIFINCLIVNPTFDSQTKENMTLKVKSFGSTCSLSDKFIKQVCNMSYFCSRISLEIYLLCVATVCGRHGIKRKI